MEMKTEMDRSPGDPRQQQQQPPPPRAEQVTSIAPHPSLLQASIWAPLTPPRMADGEPVPRDALTPLSRRTAKRRPRRQREARSRPTEPPPPSLPCPRCSSADTKFCYYNNYSYKQPRYFCRTCRRYWTKGGLLRNVPVGGGCRKKSFSFSPAAAFSSPPTTSSSSKRKKKKIRARTDLAAARIAPYPPVGYGPAGSFDLFSAAGGRLSELPTQAFFPMTTNPNHPAGMIPPQPRVPGLLDMLMAGFLGGGLTASPLRHLPYGALGLSGSTVQGGAGAGFGGDMMVPPRGQGIHGGGLGDPAMQALNEHGGAPAAGLQEAYGGNNMEGRRRLQMGSQDGGDGNDTMNQGTQSSNQAASALQALINSYLI